MNTPAEIAKNYVGIGKGKVNTPPLKLFILGIMAGIFIGIGGIAYEMATATIGGALGKLVGACMFPAGLALVLIAGSELFTGNCLMVMALLERRITPAQLLRNWLTVYLGNAVGGAAVAALAVYSHTASLFGDGLARSMVSIAESKAALGFGDAFLRGVLCNFLVCLAVWMAAASKRAEGKVIALFFPILLFVRSIIVPKNISVTPSNNFDTAINVPTMPEFNPTVFVR